MAAAKARPTHKVLPHTTVSATPSAHARHIAASLAATLRISVPVHGALTIAALPRFHPAATPGRPAAAAPARGRRVGKKFETKRAKKDQARRRGKWRNGL